MADKKKRGPIRPNERDMLSAHRDKDDQWLADRLERSISFVQKHRAQLPALEEKAERGDFISQLHVNPFWPEVRRGLVGNEVAYFEQQWAAYMNQFSSASDILATDELMIRDLVTLDIFAQRAITEKADVMRILKELERKIDKEEEKDVELRNELDLQNWRTQWNGYNASKQTLTKEHIEYQKQKDAKLKDLKGSREQRFKQIQESRRNIFELVKELDSHKKRMEEGRLAEKVKIAAQRTWEDWNEPFEYDDGSIDKPFLSPEGEMKDDQTRAEAQLSDA